MAELATSMKERWTILKPPSFLAPGKNGIVVPSTQ